MASQVFIFLFFSPLIFLPTGEPQQQSGVFARRLDRKLLGLKKEKLSHFRFYWHDILSGRNTSVIVVPSPGNSTTGFGSIRMMDNPLTLGPDLNSKLVGKCQGFYASASQTEVGFLMAMNFAFIEGKYNGSSLTVLGRNPVLNKVREMPVIGGSGLFRFARGFCEARTYWFPPNAWEATVEYNVYVLHY